MRIICFGVAARANRGLAIAAAVAAHAPKIRLRRFMAVMITSCPRGSLHEPSRHWRREAAQKAGRAPSIQK
jgi:hypothetical protein